MQNSKPVNDQPQKIQTRESDAEARLIAELEHNLKVVKMNLADLLNPAIFSERTRTAIKKAPAEQVDAVVKMLQSK